MYAKPPYKQVKKSGPSTRSDPDSTPEFIALWAAFCPWFRILLPISWYANPPYNGGTQSPFPTWIHASRRPS
jgi:hypothetical protein